MLRMYSIFFVYQQLVANVLLIHSTIVYQIIYDITAFTQVFCVYRQRYEDTAAFKRAKYGMWLVFARLKWQFYNIFFFIVLFSDKTPLCQKGDKF